MRQWLIRSLFCFDGGDTMSYVPKELLNLNQVQPTKAYIIDEVNRRLADYQLNIHDKCNFLVLKPMLARINLVESDADRRFYQTSVMKALMTRLINDINRHYANDITNLSYQFVLQQGLNQSYNY